VLLLVATGLPVHAALPGPPERVSVEFLSAPKTLAQKVRLPTALESGQLDFDFLPTHLGFSWRGAEGSGVEYRLPGGAWIVAPESHDLEVGRRHFAGVIGVDRPAGLSFRATGGARRVVIDYLNTIDGPRTVTTRSYRSTANPNDPEIVTRAQWGADESLKVAGKSCPRYFYPVQQLFVHHTAGKNFDQQPKATMRAIYWFHVKTRGWCDIGYNFVVSWDGRVFEGRWARNYASWETHTSETRDGRAVAGAHVSGFNSGSVGVSLMGNFEAQQVPPAMRRGLAELLAWESDRHDLAPKGTHRYRNPETGRRKQLPYIAGHRDAGETSCPGKLLYAALPAVRSDTAIAMGAGKATSILVMSASANRVAYGSSVTFTGQLTDKSGIGMIARPVQIYQRDGTDPWFLREVMTTGADGSFSFSTVAERNLTTAAVYEGDDATWGAQTENVSVYVVPTVSAVPEGGTPGVDGATHYPSGTTSVGISGSVTPPHPDSPIKIRIAQRDANGKYDEILVRRRRLDATGAFSYDFKPPGDGEYRVIVWFTKDDDHEAAKSPPVHIVIGP
jgi:N-acetylmuramoyl-L-alanine amidase